jgi:hypothetical protein
MYTYPVAKFTKRYRVDRSCAVDVGDHSAIDCGVAGLSIRHVQISILKGQAIGTAQQMGTTRPSRNLYSACNINHATISISTALDSISFTRAPWDAKWRSQPSVPPERPPNLQSQVAVLTLQLWLPSVRAGVRRGCPWSKLTRLPETPGVYSQHQHLSDMVRRSENAWFRRTFSS